ncbi:MAG: polysaccharide deacetylase family protein [Deltaproteobacteria bacterium]|nr:polysaccharide deacetylase family protein [Deltaproteobacteria bacterium]
MFSSTPEPDATPTRVVLKVDVDTRVGLVDGVPRLAELLNLLGLKASFFISMGPDHSGWALKRIFRPGFLQKQLHSGAAASYGLRTMLYGLLLPGPIIARRAPGRFRELLDAGHEVGLHAWDHVFWHDRLRGLAPGVVRQHLRLAADLFQEITGMAPASFAAPGWQITPTALTALEELGSTHVSCCRGFSPFRPLVHGRPLRLLELPTTMPSLDEALTLTGLSGREVGEWLAGQALPGRLNVFTLHAEVEGRNQYAVFETMLRLWLAQGVEFPRLVDAARQTVEAGGVPVGEVVFGPSPGRAYELAWQAMALGQGV